MSASVERADAALLVDNVVAFVASQLIEAMLALLFGLGVLVLAADDVHLHFALVGLEHLALGAMTARLVRLVLLLERTRSMAHSFRSFHAYSLFLLLFFCCLSILVLFQASAKKTTTTPKNNNNTHR